MSTVYHPESDGQTEQVNIVFEDTLGQFDGPYLKDLYSWVYMAEIAVMKLGTIVLKTSQAC
jgi:hypothetical protein